MADVKQARPEPKSPQMDVEAFWAAAEREELLIKECQACGEPHFYPRMVCPHCLSDRVEWKTASGRGEIYSYSTLMRKGQPGHTIAFVRLEEGVTLMSNIIDVDPQSLSIGQPVRAVFRQLKQDGPTLPLFIPA